MMNLHYDHYKETVLDTVIKEEKDGYYAFEDTVFFGEKGGMPSDKGTINGLEVLDLKWDGDTLYHKVDGTLSNPIHMEVDFLTRHNNTIVHSAIHLIHGFMVKHNLPYDAFGANLDNIWYEINTKVEEDTLIQLEQYVRQAILDSVDIEISYINGKDYEDEFFKQFDTLRIVKIGDYDSQPCSTPHVDNTREIGSFSILSYEKSSRGIRLQAAIGSASDNKLKNVYNEYKKTIVAINPGKDKLSDAAKNLVDNNGNKNTAAIKLNLSRRQIDRLVIIYNEKGKSGFVHGNRGHVPTKALDKSISNNIILLYKNKYYDRNFNHFKDLLKPRENIDVSYNFIYSTLTKNDIYSPKTRKKTKRNLKKLNYYLKMKINTKLKKT